MAPEAIWGKWQMQSQFSQVFVGKIHCWAEATGNWKGKIWSRSFRFLVSIPEYLTEECDRGFSRSNVAGMHFCALFFLKTVVRENRIPFELSAAPFYGKENIEELKRRAKNVRTGKSVLTEHGLIGVDKWENYGFFSRLWVLKYPVLRIKFPKMLQNDSFGKNIKLVIWLNYI